MRQKEPSIVFWGLQGVRSTGCTENHSRRNTQCANDTAASFSALKQNTHLELMEKSESSASEGFPKYWDRNNPEADLERDLLPDAKPTGEAIDESPA